MDKFYDHKTTWKNFQLIGVISLLSLCACGPSTSSADFPLLKSDSIMAKEDEGVPSVKNPPPAPGELDGSSLSWVGCGITKKAFMSAMAAAWFKKTGVIVAMEGGGATKGIRDVAAGLADIGGTCRHKIANDEELNCELHPVGWDALAVVVHPDNPVDNINLDQLRAIFKGEITSWEPFGQNGNPLQLFIRQGTSSGVGLMGRELIFSDPTMDYSKRAIVFKSSGPLETKLERTPNAIGITGISSAKKRALKILKLDFKLPNPAEIVSGRYPLSRPLYLVTALKPKPSVLAFLDFVQGEEGQQIIESEGTVPLKSGAKLWELYRDRVAATGGLAK